MVFYSPGSPAGEACGHISTIHYSLAFFGLRDDPTGGIAPGDEALDHRLTSFLLGCCA